MVVEGNHIPSFLDLKAAATLQSLTDTASKVTCDHNIESLCSCEAQCLGTLLDPFTALSAWQHTAIPTSNIVQTLQ